MDQIRQLKQLQDLNGRLKKLVVELVLYQVLLHDVLRKNGKALTVPPCGCVPERLVRSERAGHACRVVALPISPAQAVQRAESWMREYNKVRPHTALGERAPNEFARQIAASRDLSCSANAGN